MTILAQNKATHSLTKEIKCNIVKRHYQRTYILYVRMEAFDQLHFLIIGSNTLRLTLPLSEFICRDSTEHL